MTTDEVCLSVLIVTVAFAGLIKAARDFITYATQDRTLEEEE